MNPKLSQIFQGFPNKNTLIKVYANPKPNTTGRTNYEKN